MKACRIEPLDVVSVRDGRSFDAGGTSIARAIWPLSSWTVFGAIRARMVLALGEDPSEYGGRGWTSGALLPEHLKECVQLIGRPEDPPRFRIGPVLLRNSNGQILYPRPLDIVAIEDRTHEIKAEPDRSRTDQRDNVVRLRPIESSQYSGLWSGPKKSWLVFPPRERRPIKKDLSPYLDHTEAEKWISGNLSECSKGEQKKPVALETRIGIAIDPSKGRVQEGMFYQRRCYMLNKGWSLVVPFIDLPSDLNDALGQNFNGIGEIGGDRHPAIFAWDELEWPSPSDGSTRSVLWFLSPVHPDDLTDSNLSKMAGAEVKVLAIASEKPVSIGGWRMWRDPQGVSRPRSMRRYYPAGTCVYVEGAVKSLHGKSIAHDLEERSAGFGVCLCGAWPREVS